MPWYYAENGQQLGPVTDEQFQSLVSIGTVRADTLVWKDGMANWAPYNSVAAPGGLPTAAVPPAGGVVCAECRQVFPVEQTIRFGDAFVCSTCKPVYVQKLREGAVMPGASGVSEVRYAGFWIRFVAKFIDGLVVGVVTLPLGFIVGFSNASSFQPGAAPPNITALLISQGLLIVVGTVARMLYTWLMVGKYGATLGKMAVGLRVITADGQQVSYGRAFGRFWAEMVSGLTCSIGYIIAAFDDQKRSLHDHICSTRVIYK